MTARLPLTLLEHRLDIWNVANPSHFCEHDDMNTWYAHLEAGFHEMRISEEQWVDSAMYLLQGCLKRDMAAREEEAVEAEEPLWDWPLFQQNLARAKEKKVVKVQLAHWDISDQYRLQ